MSLDLILPSGGDSFLQSYDIRISGAQAALTANAAYLARLPRLAKPKRVASITVFIGTASGNIDAGVYSGDPAVTGTRLGSSGSVAAAGTNALQVLTPTADTIIPADVDTWVSFAADNGTVTVRGAAGNGTANGAGSLNVVKASSFVLPATIEGAAGTAFTVWCYITLVDP